MDNDFLNGIIMSYTKILRELKTIKEEIIILKKSESAILENINVQTSRHIMLDNININDVYSKHIKIPEKNIEKKNSNSNNMTNLSKQCLNKRIIKKQIEKKINRNSKKTLSTNNNMVKTINNNVVLAQIEIRKYKNDTKKNMMDNKYQNKIIKTTCRKPVTSSIKKTSRNSLLKFDPSFFSDLGN